MHLCDAMAAKKFNGHVKTQNDTERVKLYDIENGSCPNLGRGSEFRTKQSYNCVICNTKTNSWVMGGYPGLGPRLICPGDSYVEHSELENEISAQASLKAKLKRYGSIDLHRKDSQVQPKDKSNLIKNLNTEVGLLQSRIDELRKLFERKGVHDIKPNDLKPVIVDYYPSSRIAYPDKILDRERATRLVYKAHLRR